MSWLNFAAPLARPATPRAGERRRCRRCEGTIIPEREYRDGSGLSHAVALLAGFCSRVCAERDAGDQLQAGRAWWQRA